MELKKITQIDEIKKGDTLILTGDCYTNEPLKAEAVKVSKDGTEIIISRKENRFFNLGMYLKGKSWVKELAIIK